jgi:hypothetical protein
MHEHASIQITSQGYICNPIASSVGAQLSRGTFVLRKTDAVAFVPHETNGTSNVYPKTHLCDKCAPIKIFKGQESTFVSYVLRDKKHICLISFSMNYLSHFFPTAECFL